MRINPLLLLMLAFWNFAYFNLAVADAEVAKDFTEELFQTKEPVNVVQNYMRPEVLAFIGNNLQATLGQVTAYSQGFGALEGVEIVRDESISDRVRRVALVIYLEAVPMSMEIYLYKGKEKWWVNSFNFKSEMTHLHPKFDLQH
jgi:hypothetical protein